MTNDANVNMTILVLKSFLRFYNEVKVVHDDGKVTEVPKEHIKNRISGPLCAEVVSLQQADEVLKQDGKLWAQRKEAFYCFRFMPITVHKLAAVLH